MDIVTAPDDLSYEAAVQRQMLDLCKKIGRMQSAIDGALRKIDIYVLPVVEGWRRDEVVTLIAELKVALAESEKIT